MQQHLVEMVAVVEKAHHQPLEDDSEDEGDGNAGGDAEPETRDDARERECEVRAEHVEAAVREVDDPHDAEDEGQAARDEEEQQPVLHRVQDLDEKDRRFHDGRPAILFQAVSLQPRAGSSSAFQATAMYLFCSPTTWRR